MLKLYPFPSILFLFSLYIYFSLHGSYYIVLYPSYLKLFESIIFKNWSIVYLGFPCGSVVKRFCLKYRNHRKCRFEPWVRKMPWRRKWQTALVFLPRESLGQRNLAGYSHRVAKSRICLMQLRMYAHIVDLEYINFCCTT